MAREFRGDRLYRILKWVVIVVSVISLAVAIFGLINYDETSATFSEEIGKCFNIDDKIYQADCTRIWNGYLDGAYNQIHWSLIIAIGLPILFFGGTIIYNYLLPKKKG